jgi:hypothetical protein
VTVNIETGETVRCIALTTTDGATVIFENQLLPNASGATTDQVFIDNIHFGHGCIVNGSFIPDFFLIDSGAQQVCTGGPQVIVQASPSGGDRVVGLNCDDRNSTVDPSTWTVTVNIETGETVRCIALTTTDGDTGTAHNVVLTETLPSVPGGTWSVAQPSSGCSIASGVMTCRLGDLAPGVSVVVHVTSPTTVASCGTYTDAASAQADDAATVQAVASLNVIGCTGSANVHKTVSGAAPLGEQTFTFQLRQGASTTQSGTIIETGTANAGDGGIIHFTTALLAGTTFALCEVVMPGWKSTLGPSPYAVFNASGDNSTLCADFSLSPGQALNFVIDNTPPPGGLALTIGFWKNWASCSSSNGKPRPVLDQTLAAADPAGIQVGLLTLHSVDCVKAVRVLNKSTIDTGTKMSSDAAFNLAAQLLAAKLDGIAGATTCLPATTAISDAQALLASVRFDGITHDKLTKQQIAKANDLAMTLDTYNNNKLC